MIQRHKVSKSSGKMVSTYLLDAELPQTFNCIKKKKAVSAKHNKAKYNKIRPYSDFFSFLPSI